jgi:uncharacterized protein YndB with AHSA1/START domain
VAKSGIVISVDIDMSVELGAVSREVTGDDVRLTRRYPEPPDQVWSAVTTAERIERWLAPISGDLVLGGHYQVEGNAGGEVTACDPPRSFTATWEFGGHVSTVTVTLSPADGGGTLLELLHRVPSAPDHWREFGPGAVGIGWELALMGLGLHLAKPGAPRPAPEQLPDLTGMMRDCGTAWGRAAVEGGADPEWARAATQRCITAYTGEPGDAAG